MGSGGPRINLLFFPGQCMQIMQAAQESEGNREDDQRRPLRCRCCDLAQLPAPFGAGAGAVLAELTLAFIGSSNLVAALDVNQRGS